MLTRLTIRVSDLFFGMLLAVAILALGMVLGASHHQPTNTQPNTQPEQHQASNRPQPFTVDWLTHDGVVFFTAVLCFIVAVQAGLFICQLIYMRKGLDDTKIAAIAAKNAADAAQKSANMAVDTERAYVFAGYDKLIFDETGRITIPLVMTNVGKTPGMIKEVGYVFLDQVELPKTREEANWTWTTIPYDWARGSDIRTSISTLTSPFACKNIFVCYIRYTEIFASKVPHVSWMSMLIDPGKSGDDRTSRIGGEVWNGWD
jgi:hypothetical protein